MDHTQIINYLIQKYDFKTYLEIGVRNPNDNYYKINIQYKECCDIDNSYGVVTYHMPSDEMFRIMPLDKKYDIIFIDGMHDESYVDRDLKNSIKHLNPNGIICLHDVVPLYEGTTIKKDKYDDKTGFWNGDVYKSIAKLYGSELDYYTINNGDSGLGIIKYKEGVINNLNWKCKYKYSYLFDDSKRFPNNITEEGKKILNVVEIDNI